MFWINRSFWIGVIVISTLSAQEREVDCGSVTINQIPYSYTSTTTGAGDSVNIENYGAGNGEDFVFKLSVTDTITLDISLCHSETVFDAQMGVFLLNDTCGIDTIGPPTCRYPLASQGGGQNVDCFAEDAQACTESVAPTNGAVTASFRPMIYEYQLYPLDRWALKLDGIDDFAQIDDGFISTNSFSVAVWAKANPVQAGNREIISINAGTGVQFYIGKTNGNNIRAGDGWPDTGVAFPLDDAWHFYTVVKTNDNTYLYLDGAQVAELGSAIGNPDGSSLYVGKQVTPDLEHFKGDVFDIAIWDDELLANEVSTLYNSGNPVDASIDQGDYTASDQLTGYYRIDEGSGNAIKDKSGNNAVDGNIVDGEWSQSGPNSGQTDYFIVVDGYQEATGGFKLSIDSTRPPQIDSTALDENNAWVDVFINEPIFDNNEPWSNATPVQADDFNLTFNQNGGIVTAVAIQGISQQNGNNLVGGERIVRLELNVTGSVAGLETIEITPADGNAVFDGGGTPMANDMTSGIITLNGELVSYNGFPWVQDENSYVRIVFNQGVYANDDSSGGLEISDFSMVFAQNGGNAINAVMDSLKNTSGGALAGGEDSVRVYISITGTPSGVETMDFSPADNGSIYNKYGLPMLSSQNTGGVPLRDKLSPSIQSATISFDNKVIIIPTEILYSDVAATNGLDSDDFAIVFIQNNGSATNAVIESVKDTDGNAASGGEDTLVIVLNITNLPSGAETVEIIPVNNSSVFDANGNAMAAEQTTGPLTLWDKVPPEIDSTKTLLVSTNAFAALSITEGLFTNIEGNAALLISDFKVEFDVNGGTASNVELEQITKAGGNSLSGGEDSLWFYLDVSGTPSGQEKILIHPDGINMVYDANGNAMDGESTSGWQTLNPYPRILKNDVVLDEDNAFIKLVLSQGVFGNNAANTPIEVSDLQVVFTQNSGNATGAALTSITKTNGSVLLGGEDSIMVYFTLSNPPASGQETIKIKSASDNSVFNSIGNPLTSIETTDSIQLNDKLVPTFINAELTLDSAVTVTISEGVFTNADGTGWVLPADFAIDVEQNGGNASSAAIVALTRANGSALTGGETVIIVHFTLDDLPSGVEQIEVRPATDASVYDSNGNAMPMALTTGEMLLSDRLPPSIRSASNLTWDNQIEVKFTEGTFSTNTGSGGLDDSDFDLEFTNNGGNANAVSIGSVTSEWNTALNGSDLTIRLHLDFDFPPSGVESIRAYPINASSIFDESGNAMFDTETTPTFVLNDKLPPTITGVSLSDQDTIPLIIAQEIEFSISEPLQSFDLSVTAKYTDSLKYTLDTSTTSLKLTLIPPLASLDTITVTWDNLKDSANVVHDPQVMYTYYTPALGDFDWDEDIDAVDLSAFVSSWYEADYDFELGPVTGTLPHYIIQTDAEFGLDDGMAFIQMWYWKNQLNALSRPQRKTAGKTIEITISDNEIIIIPPDSTVTGQVYFEYDPFTLTMDWVKETRNESPFVLSSQDELSGKLLVEYTKLLGGNVSTLSFEKSLLQKKSAHLILVYAFFNQDGNIISEGTEYLTIAAIPKEFALHPVYPNPFNLSTTIRFDIPVETLHITSLQIFDVTGRQIDTLVDKMTEPGYHDVIWHGNRQSSGVYFAVLVRGENRQVQKMILLK